MNKEVFKKFFVEDNLLIIIDGFLITVLLVGFLIFGLSNPRATFVETEGSIIQLQQQSEENFLDEYEAGNFSVENPYFVLDPYDIAPLSGLVMFETLEAISYRLVITGKTEEANIEFVTPKTTHHFIPVYGLYPGHLNTITLYEITTEGEELISILKIPTHSLPPEIQLPTVIDTTYEYFGDDLMMLMPALGSLPVAYDFAGDVRWYLSTNLSWAPISLNNGHLLLGTNKVISDPYYTTGLYEIDYLGKIYTEYLLPGGYHHDVYEMNNGNLLIASSDFDTTVEDIVVEMDRITGAILRSWDIADYLPELDGMAEMWTTYDWFHNNSIFYDETTDSIILSGRHQDAVISIGYTSNELNWIIGDPTNWGSEIVNDYFFTPIGPDFEWQYAQHSALVLENGNIFLFDNGNNKTKLREFDISANDNYSRGVIYDIDTVNMTIEQIYQFGKELGSDFYSPYISNVAYYAEDNYLIHSGGHSSVFGEVLNIPVFLSEDFEYATLNSITIEVLDNEIVYRLEVSNHFYRANKISLYNDLTSSNLGLARTIGNLIVTDVIEGEIETNFNLFDTVPPRYDLNFIKESNRLVVQGVFDKDEIVYLVLENDSNRYEYFITTSSNTYTAMCTIIIDGDERYVTYRINEEELSGTYNIFLYVDGHKYNSYKKVTFK